jgi:hypothetical protein
MSSPIASDRLSPQLERIFQQSKSENKCPFLPKVGKITSTDSVLKNLQRGFDQCDFKDVRFFPPFSPAFLTLLKAKVKVSTPKSPLRFTESLLHRPDLGEAM